MSKKTAYKNLSVGDIILEKGRSTIFDYIVAIDTTYTRLIRGNRDSYKYEEVTNALEIEGLTVTATNDKGLVNFKTEEFSGSFEITSMVQFRDKIILAVHKHREKREKIKDVGRNMKPEVITLKPVKVNIKNTDVGSTQDKYVNIVGKLSNLTAGLNANDSLADAKDLAEAFIKTKATISSLTETKPNKLFGSLKKLAYDTGWGKKVDEAMSKNKSVQDNIDYLFGIVQSKFEKLVTTGESLQSTKGLLFAQVEALEVLLLGSNEEVSNYDNPADIPIRELSLNNQIKASVEKYKDRLLKVDGAILATGKTIIALGRDLPSLKTDLTDEMAIGSLLNSVDDYQKMFSEISTLVATVTASTSEK